MKWQVTWTGLGGILAGGNGTFVLPYLAGCRWSVTVGSITYTLQFFTGFWSLTAVTGVHAQTFVPQTLFDCLGQTYWAATPGGQPGAVSVPYTGP